MDRKSQVSITGSDPYITLIDSTGKSSYGWQWTGGALRHTTGKQVRLNAEIGSQVAAAVAAKRRAVVETLTGGQVAALPAAERTGFEFDRVVGDAIGMYSRIVTPATQATIWFGGQDVVR